MEVENAIAVLRENIESDLDDGIVNYSEYRTLMSYLDELEEHLVKD